MKSTRFSSKSSRETNRGEEEEDFDDGRIRRNTRIPFSSRRWSCCCFLSFDFMALIVRSLVVGVFYDAIVVYARRSVRGYVEGL